MGVGVRLGMLGRRVEYIRSVNAVLGGVVEHDVHRYGNVECGEDESDYSDPACGFPTIGVVVDDVVDGLVSEPVCECEVKGDHNY